MIAREVATRPEHLTGGFVESCRSVGTPMQVDPLPIHDRRRGRVGIGHMMVLLDLLVFEDDFVETTFPESKSRATTDMTFPSLVAVVIQMRSFQTTGELQANPWMAVFQRTFSVSDHRVGGDAWDADPSPLGPRN